MEEEKKPSSKIKVICGVPSPFVKTKVGPTRVRLRHGSKKDPDPDPFTYWGLNIGPNPIFKGSERADNCTTGDSFTSVCDLNAKTQGPNPAQSLID